MGFAEQVRQARTAAGLSQAELARRAGTSQARLSSYESGSVTPRPSTRERLLGAARTLPSVALGRAREEVKRLAGAHDVANVRVFGSVADGTDTLSSDIDLLVTPGPEASLLDLSAFADEVENLVGYQIHVISDRGLSPDSSTMRGALTL